jgi:HlyD family secretion protein
MTTTTTRTSGEDRVRNGISTWSLVLLVLILITGCAPPAAAPEAGADAPAEPPTNRIPLGAAERANLGITWARARRERLEKVRDVPAEIIPWPGHTWTLRSPGKGLLREAPEPWSSVVAGAVVARIASPAIAEEQRHLGEADQRRRQAALERRRLLLRRETMQNQAAVLERAAREARASLAARKAVVEQLRALAAESETRADEMKQLRRDQAVPEATRLSARKDAVDLRASVLDSELELRATHLRAAEHERAAAELRTRLESVDDEIDALNAAWRSADSEFRSHLEAFAALSGRKAEELAQIEEGRAAWTRIEHIVIRAPADAVVVRRFAAPGTQLDENAALVELLDPKVVGLRARLPESDGPRMPANPELHLILPGSTEAIPLGRASIRPLAEAATRRIILEAPIANAAIRARPGGSATARIVMARGREIENLVPSACIVEDGLDRIVFRRDPADPDQVIRSEVVVGDSSGGWTEIIAGVGSQDELVLHGASQLREAGQGAAAAGGHFHADGTWHEGDH